MKANIHPKLTRIKATCSCGNTFEVDSTLTEDIRLDVCSNCHPFYTGKQKTLDTGGQIDKFQQRFKGLKTRSSAKKIAS